MLKSKGLVNVPNNEDILYDISRSCTPCSLANSALTKTRHPLGRLSNLAA